MAFNVKKAAGSSVKNFTQGGGEKVAEGIRTGDAGMAGEGVANLYTAGQYGNVKNSASASGSSLSNAWKTSVNDPLRNAGEAAKKGLGDLANHLQDMWKGANAGLQTPQYGGVNLGVPGGGQGGPGGGVPGVGVAPQVTAGMGGVDPNDVFRNAQTTLMGQLQNQAAGIGPSIAQNQLRMGQEQALAQNIAMANSARGGANPLVARQALQTNAQQSGAMANEAANLRLQEQQQAQGALGSLTGQGRQGDLGAQQLQQQGQVSQAQIVQAQGELAAKYAQMGLDATQAQQKAAIDIARLQQEGQLGFSKLGLESQAMQNGLLGGALQGGAGILGAVGTMFSDRKLKTKIKNADAELRALLENIKPASYEYKNKEHGNGKFISPMAQDLQKSKLGKQMVEKKPEGLAVNYGANLGLILAAQASLHKRIKELEDK